MIRRAGQFYSGHLPVYPRYCRKLSPTFGRWCPLQIRDIQELHVVPGLEDQDTYLYLNHPIKWVRITGVIVAIDVYAERVVLTIDDSSGSNMEAIYTVLSKPTELENHDATQDNLHGERLGSLLVNVPDGLDFSGIDVGSVVKIRGSIGVYRGQRQISLSKIVKLEATDLEIACWNDTINFKIEILSKPWHITEDEEAACRHELEATFVKGHRWSNKSHSSGSLHKERREIGEVYNARRYSREHREDDSTIRAQNVKPRRAD